MGKAKGHRMTSEPGPVGQKIDSLSVLVSLAQCRRSVVCPNTRCMAKPLPAAFVIGMPGSVLYRLMLSGMYLYRPRRRKIATP